MALKLTKPKTPPEYLRELEREARGMNYEGWCRMMGINYPSTGWAQRIEQARRAAEEYEARQRKRLKELWDEDQARRAARQKRLELSRSGSEAS
jgi:hypothetical protein